jgi:alpha-tubulin suppressor-like RCC1 family protein
LGDAGTYQVLVSNAVGQLLSSAAVLTVPLPPTILTQPVSESVPPGFPASFSAGATGTAPFSNQWLLNGTNISGATNASYVIAAIGTNDLGVYQLLVTNIAGTNLSAPATLTFGSVAAWGRNDAGQTNVPPNLTNVVMISAGRNTAGVGVSASHNLALLANGTVVAWGNNSFGQTNVPANATNIVAVAAGGVHSLALRIDGTVIAWGNNNYGQTNVPVTLTNVVAIAASALDSYALRSDGRVVAWGNNAYNQLVVPSNLVHAAIIAGGNLQALASTTDGTVAAWGYNVGPGSYTIAGQGSVPGGIFDASGVAGGIYHSLALHSNGLVQVWGDNTYGQTNVPASLTNAIAAAAGDYHSIALRANGTVAVWGDNTYGQTNVPAAASNVVAVAAGDSHNLVLVGNGQPVITRPPVGGNVSLGRNFTLQAAVSGAAPLSYQWLFNGTNLPGATNLTLSLSNLSSNNAGSYQLVASNALGWAASLPVPLQVWNNASLSLLGQPASQTNYQSSRFTLNVSAAGNGPVFYQWNLATNVVTGLGGISIPGATNADLIFDPAMATNTGYYYCVITNQSKGGITSALANIRVLAAKAWGYSNENFDIPLDLTNPVAVAAGYQDFLGLRPNGSFEGWGYSYYGEGSPPPSLTNVAVTAIAAGNENSVALRTDGTVTAWGYPYSSLTNVPPGLSNVLSIVCGAEVAMAVRTDGTVAAWGNYTGTNVPASASNVVAVANCNFNNLALRADGTVVEWYGGLPAVPASATNVIAIAAGNSHALALRADGTVVSWGGSYAVPAGLSNVVAISAGGNSGDHSVALRADGSVVYWGSYYSTPLAQPNDLTNVIQIASGGDHDIALFGTRAPAITIRPFNRTVLKGSKTTLVAKAAGVQPVSFQWLFNGGAIAGATNDSLALTNLQFAQSGEYQVIVSNRYGVTASRATEVTVDLSLATALDATNLNWLTLGSAPWFGQTNVNHDGANAVQSGAIGNNQSSTLQTILAGPVPVSFWWKVSSEAFFNTLDFRVNGTVLTNISGQSDWQRVSFNLSPGTNLLQWDYIKTDGTVVGQDAGWVDQFSCGPVIYFQPDSQILNVSNSFDFNVGATGSFPMTFLWYKNTNTLVRNVTRGGQGTSIFDSLTMDNVDRANDGTYFCVVSNASSSVTSSNATLKVLVPQLLSAPVPLPGGGIAFTSGDIDGGLLSPADFSNFEAQVSFDLTNWTTLSNALTLTNGMLLLQDTTDTNQPQSFYRIIEQQ